jgi:hypothetical protein
VFVAAIATALAGARAARGPEAVRLLLARNPNLLADLAARTPWLGPGTVLLDATGHSLPSGRRR